MSASGDARGGVAWPILAVLVAIVSVQAGASLAKQLFPLVGPTGTTTLRLVMGTLILWAVLRPWRMRGALPWRWLLAYGVALGTMNTVFYLALQRIPLGIAVAVEFVGPLAVAVAGSRRLVDFAWVGLAAAGLLLLVPWDQAQQSLDVVGLLLALLAGVCWALYIVFGQRLAPTMGRAWWPTVRWWRCAWPHPGASPMPARPCWLRPCCRWRWAWAPCRWPCRMRRKWRHWRSSRPAATACS